MGRVSPAAVLPHHRLVSVVREEVTTDEGVLRGIDPEESPGLALTPGGGWVHYLPARDKGALNRALRSQGTFASPCTSLAQKRGNLGR